jgi:hypothetical protein
VPVLGAAHRVADVRVLGTAVELTYVPDEREAARRSAAGLGAVDRRDVLDVLLGLPLGSPVAVDDLTPPERSVLRSAPEGAVERRPGSVVRWAAAPLFPVMAVVRARSLRPGLVRAGRFAPFCARAVLLASPPRDEQYARVQASFYGIGVLVAVGGEVRAIAAPRPHVRRRHSAGHWWFAEEVHRQVGVPVRAAAPPSP